MSGFLSEEQAEVAWSAMASVLQEMGATMYLSESWLRHPHGLKIHFLNVWTGNVRKGEEFFLGSRGISKLFPYPPVHKENAFIRVLGQPDRYDDPELAQRFRDRIVEALEAMQ